MSGETTARGWARRQETARSSPRGGRARRRDADAAPDRRQSARWREDEECHQGTEDADQRRFRRAAVSDRGHELPAQQQSGTPPPSRASGTNSAVRRTGARVPPCSSNRATSPARAMPRHRQAEGGRGLCHGASGGSTMIRVAAGDPERSRRKKQTNRARSAAPKGAACSESQGEAAGGRPDAGGPGADEKSSTRQAASSAEQFRGDDVAHGRARYFGEPANPPDQPQLQEHQEVSRGTTSTA